MAGEIFYPYIPMPQGTIPRPPKVIVTTTVTVDNPLPTRREIFTKIREAWNIPSGSAISNRSLGRMYQAAWDVPGEPPPIAAQAARLMRIVLQHYGMSAGQTEAVIQEILRQRNNIPTPGTLPSIDNPPPGNMLSARLMRIVQIYQAANPELLNYRMPDPSVRRSGWLIVPPLPPPVPQVLGSIAFQPDAFFMGYPRQYMGFQAQNHYAALFPSFVYPYVRIVALRSQTGQDMEEARRGTTVILGCETYDPALEPERLFTPEEVRVTLYNPDGTIRLDDILLTPTALGRQIYRHQVALDDQVGIYLVEYRVQNFGNSAILPKQAAFKVVEG